jgi:hypothetical protein
MAMRRVLGRELAQVDRLGVVVRVDELLARPASQAGSGLSLVPSQSSSTMLPMDLERAGVDQLRVEAGRADRVAAVAAALREAVAVGVRVVVDDVVAVVVEAVAQMSSAPGRTSPTHTP